MKRTSSKIIVIAGILFCLLGCHGREDQGHAEHEPGHESHGAGLQLALDDGQKWQVDEPTRESATKIAALVAGAEPFGTVEDARTLGEALDGELDTLVKRCKMTGPAHDQLHVFLVALFPKVEALALQTDVADLQRTREEIDELLEAYEAHFE